MFMLFMSWSLMTLHMVVPHMHQQAEQLSSINGISQAAPSNPLQLLKRIVLIDLGSNHLDAVNTHQVDSQQLDVQLLALIEVFDNLYSSLLTPVTEQVCCQVTLVFQQQDDITCRPLRGPPSLS